ncbi:glutathionylspermidine synthase [Terriglobus roseus DSM 18391]|uniref:Glutathionylspermidine synthase n=1 Tax=Terriglobus roseus (strain DSM 18391 / NRRL B-41598 / KBS 63) TaxID=926566 RepID=I3ZMB6_TERRK|nr:glutathionylspermidine synthase family protein [Terriglobus roseus]AFL90384.1 glutathionylspermidine synthase [Terriglobus roseus DSM 18391]
MQRNTAKPRADWQRKVEVDGLTFHSPEDLAEQGAVYWDESAFYSFNADEIDTLESAANELQTMCLAAAQHIIDTKRYADLTIPPEAIPLIERTWNSEPPALYGRFDLMYDGSGPPKLLEYNADTPTSLIEAAVTQWNWLNECHVGSDQFNSLHERLVAKWKDIAPFLQQPVHFASADSEEDVLTVAYLRDTAQEAGLATAQLLMEEIGWDNGARRFVDLEDQPIRTLFKLYPWECLLAESFGPDAIATYDRTTWIEPIWKMLLANKGILPILWELYPNHPLLLEAYFDDPHAMRSYVRKPLLSREGANITLVAPGASTKTEGRYGEGRFVCQQAAPLATFPAADGSARYPVLGLWMIDQECGGMGIRESRTPITGNLSSFVPHLFR